MDLTELKTVLSEFNPADLIFIGLGNEFRSDDRAGLIIFNKIKTLSEFYSSHFIQAETNPENYLEEILNRKAEVIIFIDAVDWGGKAGEIRFLPNDIIDSFGISTHTFSIKMIEEYLLNYRKLKFFYIGIQPSTLEFGKSISAIIKKKIQTFFVS